MTLLDEIESCIPALRRYANALVRDRESADDLVQDCLERAVARRRHWRGDGSVRGWLFRILLNLFRDQRRSVRARVHLVPAESLAETARLGDQEDRLALREVHSAIGRLPPDQRAALLLVALEGFTLHEAAEALGIPEGTLTSRLARARRALRQETGRGDGGSGNGMEVVR
jgi:RNA polymerase sigma-70 factor (ECF subfamily)